MTGYRGATYTISFNAKNSLYLNGKIVIVFPLHIYGISALIVETSCKFQGQNTECNYEYDGLVFHFLIYKKLSI